MGKINRLLALILITALTVTQLPVTTLADNTLHIADHSQGFSNGLSYFTDGGGLKIIADTAYKMVQSMVLTSVGSGMKSTISGMKSTGSGIQSTGVFVPTVETETVSDISFTQATFHGLLTSTVGDACTKVNFQYRQKDALRWRSTGIKSVYYEEEAKFSAVVTGLLPNTQYEFMARAYNTAGWGEGNTLLFTSNPNTLPDVITEPIKILDVDKAALHGTISGSASSNVTDSGFFWGTFEAGSLNMSKVDVTPDESGKLSIDIDELVTETKYYYRAYATTPVGTTYGKLLTFRTPFRAPMVVHTQTTTDVATNSAVLNGKVTGGEDVFSTGFEVTPGFAGKIEANLTSDGSFSYLINGLLPGITYVVRAYATDTTETIYSEPVSFMTLPDKPAVVTKPVILDPVTGNINVSGSILLNGGIPITHFGFLLRYGDNEWSKLPVGTNHIGDFCIDGLNTLIGLLPGTTYYVKAYAANAQGEAHGEEESFVTPVIPEVTCSIDASNIGATTAMLNGDITDAGGENVICTVFRFQYRLKGDTEWINVDINEGSFGADTFQFELTGLRPGIKYEFRAQADNSAGTGTSSEGEFTAIYGIDNQDAFTNMADAGYSQIEIADVLKNSFGTSSADAFLIFENSGSSLTDTIEVLKNAAYKETAAVIAHILYNNSYDAFTAAEALSKTYFQKEDYFSRSLISCLAGAGYSVDDSTQVMKTMFDYPMLRIMDTLKDSYPKLDVNKAIIEHYSLDIYADTLFSFEFFDSLREVGVDVVESIRMYYIRYYGDNPPTRDNLRSLKFKLSDAGYSLQDMCAAFVRGLGADHLTVFSTLYYDFSSMDLAICLYNETGANLDEMALAFSKMRTTKADETLQILHDIYKPSAQDMIMALYAAGWIEKRPMLSAGLGGLAYALATYYNINTPEDAIGLLKECGLSYLHIVETMATSRTIINPGMDYYSWIDRCFNGYKQHGLTAAEAVVGGMKVPLNSHQIIEELVQVGFSLSEIVTGMKLGYGYTMPEAFNGFPLVNSINNYGWTDENIAAAINEAYSPTDPPAEMALMREQGYMASYAASILIEIFGVDNAVDIAQYLKQGGYGRDEVLYATIGKFVPQSPDYHYEALKLIPSLLTEVYEESGEYTRPVLDFVARSSVSVHLAYLRWKKFYTTEQIALLLKKAPPEGYGLSDVENLMILADDSFSRVTEELLAMISQLYGTDIYQNYVKYLRYVGESAGYTFKYLSHWGIPDLLERTRLMINAGYTQSEILQAVKYENREDVFIVLSTHYGISDATAMVNALIDEFGIYYYGLKMTSNHLNKLFNTELHESLMIFKKAGHSKKWLYDSLRGIPFDDKVASILGNLGDEGLEFEVWQIYMLLDGNGYDKVSIYKYMRVGKYTDLEIFNILFVPGNYQQFLRGLKKAGIEREEMGKTLITGYKLLQPYTPYKWMMMDMVYAGFSFHDTIKTYLEQGGTLYYLAENLEFARTGFQHDDFYTTSPFDMSQSDKAKNVYAVLREMKIDDDNLVDYLKGYLHSAWLSGDEHRIAKDMAGLYLDDAGVVQQGNVTLGATIDMLRQAGASMNRIMEIVYYNYQIYDWKEAVVVLSIGGCSSADIAASIFTHPFYMGGMFFDVVGIVSAIYSMGTSPGVINGLKLLFQFSKAGWSVGSAVYEHN